METVTQEIRAALDAGLYYLAVMITFTLPDICAALESPNGKTTGPRYKAWYNTWLASQYPSIAPDDLWHMRCGVVHEGRLGHSKMQYARILFTVPNAQGNVFHNNILNDALNLDVVIFCTDILTAVDRWYADMRDDPNVIANLPRLMQYREQGLSPYMVGIPLIA